MLKRFFLNTLSGFIGAWIALVLFVVAAVMVCIGLAAKFGAGGETAKVERGSVMTIDLGGMIAERESPTDLDYLSLIQGDVEKPKTLASLVKAIGEAAENKDIDAIYLKCNGVQASPATLDALRASLSGFRKKGKKIIAYGNFMMNGDYYVASVADSVFMNPGGQLLLQGIGGTNLYLKGLFDKLGVQFQVVKVGTYKSAVEPYIHTEMSAPARAQLDTLYGGIWSVIRESIADSRKGVTAGRIDTLVNEFIFTKSARYVQEQGLVDRLVYERQMDSIIGKMIGKDKDDVNFVSPETLTAGASLSLPVNSKNTIAILYACGEIVDGGNNSTVNYKKLVPQIVELAEDDNIKGMVLRVNSPGGSAFGSEQIGEALDYFQSKGKPLAVSMGDYAASGGYWISAGTDRIFANRLTITGSIGIFGLIPNIAGLIDKIGVSPQQVSTNPQADFPAIFKPMDAAQQEAMQKFVERGYDTFVARVAKGRKMSEEKVRTIGEGRVWGAQKALEIGLVDELGSLQDATDWVAEKAGLEKSFDTAVYPLVEPSVWDFIPQLAGIKLDTAVGQILKEDYSDFAARYAAKILQQPTVQARMPYIKVTFGERVLR